MYKTPGVYIKEISTLPPSVAPVETAIPAFVGYVTKNVRNDEEIEMLTPTRVTSLLEFVEWFGGPFIEFYDVTLTDPPLGETEANVAIALRAASGEHAPLLLYYHIEMFYANGGGPCWIVPVDVIANPATDPLPAPGDLPALADLTGSDLTDAVAACEEIDEITILAVPEAMLFNSAVRKSTYDSMLAQCAKLQDRFAILDVLSDPSGAVFNDGVNFRSDDVGANDLRYGAAYYPELKTIITRAYSEDSIHIVDNRTNPVYDDERLSSIQSGLAFGTGTPLQRTAYLRLRIEDNANVDGDSLTFEGDGFSQTVVIAAQPSASDTALTLAGVIPGDVNAQHDNGAPTHITISAALPGIAGNKVRVTYTDSGSGPSVSLNGQMPADGQLTLTMALEFGSDGVDTELYKQIAQELDKRTMDLYPSGAVAGIYARVDRTRGVWKAPANTSVKMLSGLSVMVTDVEQRDMNVDSTSGKSINVIREFFGKGQIVWGARTLAGNDNEWRYVSVRRFYNFVEESVKKASEPFVFEPNDANTWLRIKGMIENFLTGLWREGALAGASVEEAFFVKVGLGETMTSIDILEGRMQVEIGMAVVRPAEFIILKFSHKMQVS